MKIGFRVRQRTRQVGTAVIEAFRGIPVANISDSMSRLTAGGAALRPMHAGGYMAGPALTVRTRPGDNLMVHKAIDIALPGDIIVVDAGGVLTQAIIGDLMLNHLIRRGVAGIVINGAVRDLDFIAGQNTPVYAAGVTHRGPYKDGPGEINVPIAIDGMVIEPGDLIVGDGDGVVVVPAHLAEEIASEAAEQERMESFLLARIAAGAKLPGTYPPNEETKAAYAAWLKSNSKS